ncbi:DegV family protein [uncultured Dysosmobacter sp.]|uniref:DegV family protein n=1 Tax=uncultured Dysosmobacter sp. TaxID=2591384 RepID=UPI002627C295|nr:DegV family protein [uncultured Dysosmobacter sp.]
MSVQIITDSASDITQAEAAARGIRVLPLRTIFDGQEFLDGVTMDNRQFFQRLVESDTLPTTSQMTPYEYEQAFRSAVDAGDEALCVTLSSKLSGCCQSARIAAEEVPAAVVDSENVCIGQRILVELAVRLRDQGLTAAQIAETLEREKKNIRLIALLDTLEYLKKGGRISPAVALAGSLLSIKPVIAIEHGEVAILGKARGSKNGSNMLTELVRKCGGINFEKPYCLAYSGLSDALLQKYIADSAPLYAGHTERLPISAIGSTIGTHAGPGAIAAAFFING